MLEVQAPSQHGDSNSFPMYLARFCFLRTKYPILIESTELIGWDSWRIQCKKSSVTFIKSVPKSRLNENYLGFRHPLQFSSKWVNTFGRRRPGLHVLRRFAGDVHHRPSTMLSGRIQLPRVECRQQRKWRRISKSIEQWQATMDADQITSLWSFPTPQKYI